MMRLQAAEEAAANVPDPPPSNVFIGAQHLATLCAKNGRLGDPVDISTGAAIDIAGDAAEERADAERAAGEVARQAAIAQLPRNRNAPTVDSIAHVQLRGASQNSSPENTLDSRAPAPAVSLGSRHPADDYAFGAAGGRPLPTPSVVILPVPPQGLDRAAAAINAAVQGRVSQLVVAICSPRPP